MKKSFDNKFKFKVVLEAIKGDLTIAEIISKYQVSQSVIHKWPMGREAAETAIQD